MSNIKSIAENDFYVIKHNEDLNTVKLLWKERSDLKLDKFKEGIIQFSSSCESIKPKKAAIDARLLDQKGDPFLWVSGQKEIHGIETYNLWWEREIAPAFNGSGIWGLGVATGNPNAPGELPQVPEGVNFKIAYFTDFDQVLEWKAD